jgi:hypothetical protein
MKIGVHFAHDAKAWLDARAAQRDDAGCRDNRVRRREDRPATFAREREFRSSIQVEIDCARLRHSP